MNTKKIVSKTKRRKQTKPQNQSSDSEGDSVTQTGFDNNTIHNLRTTQTALDLFDPKILGSYSAKQLCHEEVVKELLTLNEKVKKDCGPKLETRGIQRTKGYCNRAF